MAASDPRAGLFPALLKHWRGQRGLSQLDFALAAEVSARHISFLETGRSKPSAEMVVRLATVLGVPLRHVNAMLEAAGHAPVYEGAHEPLPDAVTQALDLMKTHQEPFPLFVVDRVYAVRDVNEAAARLFNAILGFPPGAVGPKELIASGSNLAVATFDPHQAQPYVANFAEVGRQLLWRIQRELLAEPDDQALHALLTRLLAMPTVPPDWRDIDLSVPSDPALVIHLRRGDLDLRFVTTITIFQAPQNVAVEELRIEQWFPCDADTAEVCRHLGQ